MYRLTALACLSLGLGPALVAQKPLPTDRQAGAAAVTDADLREWLGTLASPEFEGRGTGQEGFRKAAQYVRAQFQALGLEPGAADGSYWQRVPWGAVTPDREATQLVVSRGGQTTVRLDGTALSGRVSGPLQATGGITVLVVSNQEESGIADLDLTGRIALIYLRPAAAAGNRGGTPTGNRGRRGGRQGGRRGGGATRFLREATDAGAAIALAVQETPGQGLTGSSGSRAGGRAPTNQISIARADLERILAVATVETSILAGDQLRTDLTGLIAELNLVTEGEFLPAWNVIGILPGTDPQLKDEYVVIGSHLDHNGIRNGTIYPGADDDASGSAGVIAVAKAFVNNPIKPRRSILFVEFCGEENGLIGSGYFADNPPIPLSSIVGELQMDMIGRNEEFRDREGNVTESADDNTNTLHLIGTEKLSKDLHALALARNELAGFDLEFDEEDVFFRSDHANFAKYGVPIAFFFTGFHPDYHQPTDTYEKINYEKLGRITTYVYDIAFELAQSDTRPLIDPELWEANRVRLRSPVDKPAAPMRDGK